jgi:ribonuclease P protein component
MGASGSVPDRAAPVSLERLKRRSDFRAAAGGLRAASRAFVLQARCRGDQGAARVGFTVSRQVGNAVERNRVRRRLREMVRVTAAGAGGLLDAPDDGRLHPGHDYVLVGRRAALAAPFADMVQEFTGALGRIAASEAGERGGTGSARGDALHEAGSPTRTVKPRESGPNPRKRSTATHRAARSPRER